MSQNDMVISNQSAPAFRADLNSALQALASVSSGATEPATKYANQLWYDTGTNTLKKRNEANSAWVAMGTFDEGAGTFTPNTVVQTQTQETWNTGTDTTESFISPAKLEAKFDYEIDDRIENKLNASGSAPLYACRAWVNFNGKDTVAIRASGNVSSVTDNGTGSYTVNFTTAMPDMNYGAIVSPGDSNARVSRITVYSVWSVRIVVSSNETNTSSDSEYVNVAIFR